jgi:hypothetical protein
MVVTNIYFLVTVVFIMHYSLGLPLTQQLILFRTLSDVLQFYMYETIYDILLL